MVQITFIIPCYNYEKKILISHNKILKFIKNNHIKANIIYIDDGSKDKTLDCLKSIKSKKINILKNKFNLGKSSSIRKAIKKVKTKYVVLIDCDLPYFNFLKKVINEVKKNDFVTVNRKLNQSKDIEKNKNLYQNIRGFVSNFLGYIIEKKLNLKVLGDTQAGLKAFRIDGELKNYHFISKYYFLDIELIHFFKIKRKKIKLVPVKYKISKQSNIKIFSFNNLQVIYELIKVLTSIKSSLNS